LTGISGDVGENRDRLLSFVEQQGLDVFVRISVPAAKQQPGLGSGSGSGSPRFLSVSGSHPAVDLAGDQSTMQFR
jgi:hypothetical protein